MIIPGVKLPQTDPLPKFRRMTGFHTFKTKGDFPTEAMCDLGICTCTLPYRIQDRYTSERKPIKIKTVTLENKYLRAVFTPEYGGKLWSLYDKENKRDLLMSNPVLQPRNLAIRNAWTSGGIEWNFGSLGHTYFTCDDVFCAVMEHDGEKIMRIYEFERAKECVFQIDFMLPKDSRCLYSHVKVTNPNDEDTTTYWWTNAAIPEDGKTRVLSSSEQVIAVCGGNLTYEKMPHLSVMDGDLSYPINASRSFDYFFQPEGNVVSMWESAVNRDGYAFYERSTCPLIYRKMFCWGNHRGGKRWQEYLSDDKHGDYIELQAGIARSQMHDKLFPAKSSIEWTQCFGGTHVPPESVHDVEFQTAIATFGKNVDTLIPENNLLEIDKKMKKLALKKTKESDIVHFGSGWGALELLREKKIHDIRLPESVCFPTSALSKDQETWIELLNTGRINETSTRLIPPSWMTSRKWYDLLQKSIDDGAGNWLSYLHLGNMIYEFWDNSHVVEVAKSWSMANEYEVRAERSWLRSDEIRPNVFAKRNLAVLYKLRGDVAMAERYYDELFALPEATKDFSFAAEYMNFLNGINKYEKSLSLYESLPSRIQNADRVTLCFALAALKLDMPERIGYIFDRDFAAIREGETSLSDFWFEYHARLMAKSRGILYNRNAEALIAEAEKDFPPPHKIDFRMSYNKVNRYRSTE